jgi:tRNA1Val (adenine37-N6)-methyltransferase
MKVCTDACVFGAWFAAKIADYSMILDIGSGTGLLIMMLAQKSSSEIHGIEIDLSSFKQLKENISQNEWAPRLKVSPGDAKTFSFPGRYDFIITNPPFYEHDLAADSEQKNLAMHSRELKLEELVTIIHNNLAPHGSFGILLPYHRWEYFDRLAMGSGFFLTEKLFLKQSPLHSPFRAILHYSRHKENFIPEFELIIHDKERNYTVEFTELMKDYYLKL